MSVSQDPYVWIAALLTLGVFSFLYRDNAVFCFIEHLLVGLSTGYMICTYWDNVFLPELVQPLLKDGTGKEAHLWFALFLCLLWACKLAPKANDLYRLALAFWIGIDMGMVVTTNMQANVLAQIAGTLSVSFSGSPVVALGNAVLFCGTIAALCFFFFSRPHVGVLGASAKLGTWVLMIGFGATFSYTILSRVYLLVGRFLFLLRDWLGVVS